MLTTALREKLHHLQVELLAEGASPLERLLVDHIGVCWLARYALELMYSYSRTVANQRKAAQAGTQFEQAIASLATLRSSLKK